LDEISDEALSIGAVNTIKNENGRLIGYNTDGRGFMQSLSENSIDITGKKILIVGAGGASRAIGYYLCKESSIIYLFDIDEKKAELLKNYLFKIKNNVLVVDKKNISKEDFFNDIDIIVNATPLGLKPDDPLPIDISLIKERHIVCDLIYKETSLLKEAFRKGCKTMDGLGMLLWQGALAYEIWTGIIPPIEIMRKALLESRN
jgi:shikimate dehydrogenase